MKRILPLALLLAACAPQTDENHTPDSGAATAGQVTTTNNSTPTAAPTEIKGNPNRVHQLTDLKKTDLRVKGTTIHAWIMDDQAKQEEGMMFLTDAEVKPDEGMLFAFPEVQPTKNPNGTDRGFWMHNTLIPLDIVYLTTAGKVVNVGHGEPQNDDIVKPEGEYQYVLEIKAGTAARLGLKAGDTIPIPKL